jgi:hypothetical protein
VQVAEDVFAVKYDADAAGGGQAALEEHRDGSELSFVVGLNDPASCFEGGGTRVAAVEPPLVVRPPEQGSCLSFCGRQPHGGVAVTRGTRYILAGFVRVVDDDLDSGSEEEVYDDLDSGSEEGEGEKEKGGEGKKEEAGGGEGVRLVECAPRANGRATSGAGGGGGDANAASATPAPAGSAAGGSFFHSYHGTETRDAIQTGGPFCDCDGAACAVKRRVLGGGSFTGT